MGITMFTFNGLFAPLQALVDWYSPPVAAQRVTPSPRAAVIPQVTRICQSRATLSGRREGARRPLRVVRVVEGVQTPAHAGRMVISGRMADVCAELDRLAALGARAG